MSFFFFVVLYVAVSSLTAVEEKSVECQFMLPHEPRVNVLLVVRLNRDQF